MKYSIPLLNSEIIGPMRFLNNNVILDEKLPMAEIIKGFANLPLMRFSAFVGNIIGNYNYELGQFFIFSFVYFIGVYLLSDYFIKEKYISLGASILLSLTPLFVGTSFYGYPFGPVTEKTIGCLAQGLHPLILFALISRRFRLAFILLVLLLFYHLSQGILFVIFACGYIIFLNGYNLKKRAGWILLFIAATAVYTLYILNFKECSISFTEWKRLAAMNNHAFTWLSKKLLASFLYLYLAVIASLVVIKSKEKRFRDFFTNGIRNINMLYYLALVIMVYVGLMFLLSIAADMVKSMKILILAPNRLTTLLTFTLLIQIIVISRFLIDKFRTKAIPLIVLLIFSFYYSPLLFFPVLLLVFKESFDRYTTKQIVGFSVVIFLMCLIDFYTFTALSAKKVMRGILYVSLWLITCIFVKRSSRIRHQLSSVNYHLVLILVILFGVAFKFTYNGANVISSIEINMKDRELLDYIDKTIPKNKVFFVFQSPSLKDYYLYYFASANFRNVILTNGVIVSSTYFPELMPRINEDLGAIYSLSLRDIEDSPEGFFLLYKKAITFSSDDWLRIKGRYRDFEYVLMSDNTNYLPPFYFVNIFNNNYFKLYKINWEILN